jgi:hypothetical protein
LKFLKRISFYLYLAIVNFLLNLFSLEFFLILIWAQKIFLIFNDTTFVQRPTYFYKLDLAAIVFRSDHTLFVVLFFFSMTFPLFVRKYHPAFNTKSISIAFHLWLFKLPYEKLPFNRVFSNHEGCYNLNKGLDKQ